MKIKKRNPGIRTFLAGDLIVSLGDKDNNLSMFQMANSNFKSFMKDRRRHECLMIVSSDAGEVSSLK